jgi:multidrug efflux pump subunit AcrA (membrane-fusion protein)
VHVPADELVFVTEPPVRVSDVLVSVGDAPEGPLMLVTDAVVAIDSSVPIAEARLIHAGMPVLIDEPDLDIEASGTVSAVAAGPGTNELDSNHVYFEVTVDGDPEDIVGTSLRLTIPVESTEGEVLTVPVSALTLGADGSTRVEKVTPDGNEVVTVDPGLSADGYVEIVPADGSLAVGDSVVIGLGAAPPGES